MQSIFKWNNLDHQDSISHFLGPTVPSKNLNDFQVGLLADKIIAIDINHFLFTWKPLLHISSEQTSSKYVYIDQ